MIAEETMEAGQLDRATNLDLFLVGRRTVRTRRTWAGWDENAGWFLC